MTRLDHEQIEYLKKKLAKEYLNLQKAKRLRQQAIDDRKKGPREKWDQVYQSKVRTCDKLRARLQSVNDGG